MFLNKNHKLNLLRDEREEKKCWKKKERLKMNCKWIVLQQSEPEKNNQRILKISRNNQKQELNIRRIERLVLIMWREKTMKAKSEESDESSSNNPGNLIVNRQKRREINNYRSLSTHYKHILSICFRWVRCNSFFIPFKYLWRAILTELLMKNAQ